MTSPLLVSPFEVSPLLVSPFEVSPLLVSPFEVSPLLVSPFSDDSGSSELEAAVSSACEQPLAVARQIAVTKLSPIFVPARMTSC
jgi:hypothetical protein